MLSGFLGRRGGRLPVLGLAGLLAVCLVLGAALRLGANGSEALAALGAGFSGWYEGLPPGVPVALVAGLAWGLGVLAGRDAYDGAWLAFGSASRAPGGCCFWRARRRWAGQACRAASWGCCMP